MSAVCNWTKIANKIIYCWLFFLIFSLSDVFAQTTNILPDMHLLLVQTVINQRAVPGIMSTYLDHNNRLWVAKTDITQMGLIDLNNSEKIIHGSPYLCLNDYPHLKYRVNYALLQLNIQAPITLFKEQIINNDLDQTQSNHKFIRPTAPGVFLNYDVSAEHVEADNAPDNNVAVLTELGLFNQWGTGSTHYLFQNLNRNQSAIRLDTTWTQDQPENLASWRLGDSITSSASWSGATRFGGIQYTTNFATQPNLVTFPLPDIRGQAVLPSTVNLLVNNVMTQQTGVNPGPFIINNVPVVTGAGTMSIVTQDIMGRQEVVSVPYYSAPQLLKQGLTNFSYEAGFIRENYGITSDDYHKFVSTATYSQGINDSLTLTGHGELEEDQQTVGGTSNYLWNQLGVLSLSLAVSKAVGKVVGELLDIGFSRQATPLSYGMQTTFMTHDFTQIGFLAGQLAPISTSQAFAGYDLGHKGSLALSYTYTQARNSVLATNAFSPPSSELLTATYSKNLFKSGSLTIGSIDDLKNHANSQIFLMLTIAFDSVHTGSLNVTRQNDEQQYSAQFTKALPVGDGYGYQLYTSHGSMDQTLGSFTAQNEVGEYNLAASRFNQQNNYQADIRGSVIHFGGVTKLARNFDNSGSGSFGLVEVPGFKNVRIYDQNQLIGTTDTKGNLFVPNLLPYQTNQLRIEPADLPVDSQISTTEQAVMPYYRSGVIITFPVTITHSVIFHLITAPNHYVPTGALLKFADESQDYLVGEQGEVYFDRVTHDKIMGTAYWGEQHCHFTLAVPEQIPTIPDLGEVICH